MENLDKYFKGESLYGDNFSYKEILNWYIKEEEAYANLYGENIQEESFNYFPIILYGYKYLSKINCFSNVLGFGSSWGYEFIPVINKINKLSIIDSSSITKSKILGNTVSPIYYKPTINGEIKFEDNCFDLINVLSTLHHIPNVTFVLGELFRVLKKGGYMLLKEPITSMGDWRTPRYGLTSNERGIPVKILDNIIKNNDIKILHKHYFGTMTPFLMRITNNHSFFSSKFYYKLDKYFSMMLKNNINYHPINKIQRIAPQYVFYVLYKK